MKFLGTILLFMGYCFIYAAVAHGGVFATDPWSGIFSDAYTDVNVGGGGSKSNSPANSGASPVRPRGLTPSTPTISGLPPIQLPQTPASGTNNGSQQVQQGVAGAVNSVIKSFNSALNSLSSFATIK